MVGPQFRLSEEHAGFIESGVSIIVASHDARNRPLLGHAIACRVSPTGRRVTVLVSRRKYPLLVDAIRRSGAIAVNFNEPSSNKSIQLKGAGAELAAVDSDDAKRMAAYLDLFTADLARIGVSGALVRAALACPIGDVTAVAFSPLVAFTQTPGPRAGNRITA